MKKLLLLALLVIGCTTELTDCAGIVGLAISQFEF